MSDLLMMDAARPATLSQVLDLMREIEALKADNAALVAKNRAERRVLSLLYHRIKALGVHDATDAMSEAVTTVECWMDEVPDTYETPHPGAALLEEVRTLRYERSAHPGVSCHAVEAALRWHEDATQRLHSLLDGGTPRIGAVEDKVAVLIAALATAREQANALGLLVQRARDEALEEAATDVEVRMQTTTDSTALWAYRVAADNIRALKSSPEAGAGMSDRGVE